MKPSLLFSTWNDLSFTRISVEAVLQVILKGEFIFKLNGGELCP